MNQRNRTYLFYGSLMLLFLLSRLWAREAGVQFNTLILPGGWQLLDLELLQHNLAESLWYLHAQPPLYNLLVGVALKITNGHPSLFLELLYATLGLISTCMLAHSLRSVGVSAVLSFIAPLLFFCSPAAILYENWAFYTQLELFGLTALFWATVQYFKQDEKAKWLWAIFGFAAALCLTRSMYHWAFFVALAGLMILFSQRKKRVFAIALLPFLLLTGWYAKNAVLFGSFSASSWTGMNFARMSYNGATDLGKIGIWSEPEKYDSLLHFSPSPYSSAAVSSMRKQNGAINFNYYGYIQVSKQFGQEAWAELKKNPTQYRQNIHKALFIFFEPPSQHRFGFLEPNYSKISTLNTLYHLGYRYPTGEVGNDLIYLAMGLYVLVLLGALVLLFSPQTDKSIKAIVVFVLFFVLYVCIVGNLFEVYENNRFRFPTIPLVLFLTGLEIQMLIRFFGHRAHREDTVNTEKNTK